MKKQNEPSPELFVPEAPRGAAEPSKHAPLAVRMRPRSLEEIVGQEHILGEGKLLRRTIEADRASSMIFYGPPGSGKTTLARVISRVTSSVFVPMNAVTANVAELRRVLEDAHRLKASGRRTILFIDEIHRFNKAQQDVLMPDAEDGTIILIGATTHNPSFTINGPLLSRSVIFELRPIEVADLVKVMKRAIADTERGLGHLKIRAEDKALEHIAKTASGDARRALIALEVGALTTPPGADGVIDFNEKVAEESCQRRVVYYDHDEDYHYDTASAFIKSMRGSDPDAGVYWLAKMLYAGEDPRFIIRRILILASEDIGNADPQALILAAAGLQAIEFVGLPEAQLILSHLVTYMCLAPKSNASTVAIGKAMEDVKSQKVQEVPDHLRDSHYKGAEKMGHGTGYQYPHSEKGVVRHDQAYLPEDLRYYFPKDSGFEKILAERLARLKPPKNTK